MASPFVLDVRQVQELLLASKLPIEDLLTTLVKPTQALARPPISRLFVAAVGYGASGRIFKGVNLEFLGLPLHHSVHAEQFLVANAAQHGERELLLIAVSAAPCGHCRQFLQELRGAPELRVLIADAQAETQSLSYFLPHRFGPEDILHGEFPLLLEPRPDSLSLKPLETDGGSSLASGRDLPPPDLEEEKQSADVTPSNVSAVSPQERLQMNRKLAARAAKMEMDLQPCEPDLLNGNCSFPEDHFVGAGNSAISRSNCSQPSSLSLNLETNQRENLGSPCSPTSSWIPRLQVAALQAANKSHAPYSNCPCGMALLTRKGKIYSGSYMESVAHNPSLPPLQAALVAFVSQDGGSYEDIIQAVLVEKEDAVMQFAGTAQLALQKISPNCSFHVCHALEARS